MRRRLDLAGALVARPPVVVLDEPTTGLDPRGRADTWQAVRSLVTEGTTVLLTTQYLEEADQLADAIVVIESGTVVARGSAAQLKARVGGERLSLTVAEPRHRSTATEILATLGEHLPDLDQRTGRLTVATDHGARSLEYALSRLRLAGIVVQDVGLAPPTLDDVFLSLTGRPIAPDGATASPGVAVVGGGTR